MKQSDKLKKGGYLLDEHNSEEPNAFTKGQRIAVFFVRHAFQAPYYLAELETTFAEAGTREEALRRLTKLLKEVDKK